MKKITRDMTLGEVVMKHPEAAGIMINYGLHCVGCHVSDYETLEQGLRVHGKSEEEIDTLIKELNEVIKDFEENAPEK